METTTHRMRPDQNLKTDAELMLEVAAGARESAGVLFTRHHQKLYRYFFSIMRNRADSMDAVQDVFDRLIRYGHSFRGGTFLPWLFRIAKNVANDQYRKPSLSQTSLETFQRVDPAPLPDRHLEMSQDKRVLAEALNRLSPAYREVLVLSRYADLSYKEISSVLDCSGDAVKVRVHRALTSLKKNYLELSQAKS